MRQVHTVPMEVFSGLANGPVEIEPHEAGWATEALAMVYIREAHGTAPSLVLRAQISVDGYRWIDTGRALEPITAEGGYALALDHFGNWLRLVGEVTGGPNAGPAFVADLYWVFK